MYLDMGSYLRLTPANPMSDFKITQTESIMASDDRTLGLGTGRRKTPHKTLPGLSVQGMSFKSQLMPLISVGQGCHCVLLCVGTSLTYLPSVDSGSP